MSAMASRWAFAAAFAAFGYVHAQNNTAFSGPGPLPEGQDFLEDAQVTAEKTVSFDLYFPNDGNAPRWQLITRLEEAPPPDTQIPNAQVLNTVYDFGFPNGGNLTQAVAASSGQLDQNNFCVTILQTQIPSSRANDYNADTEDNASEGSCAYPFRDACINAIAARIGETEPGEDGCRMSAISLTDLVQCEAIFESDTRVATYNLLAPDVTGNLTGGFAHITSDPYDGNNRTFFDIAETRIHFVAIDSGNTFTPLCVKVDAERDQVTAGAPSLNKNLWLVGAVVAGALAYVL
ncbi:hypothetical protein CB0940_00683 [Cercospora beticola]|uniref:Uncharacterized protein n=1 Tax=Cercospora beticola TaxID=122368 RepID=A0A2G5IB92_CERBT|nr:hypothetical protein CB0940_00683 [Cercospora beticola]PIB02078.1 hypothetical protein CB0940_00683 [Cercospora beticola]WPA96110.1 hypothetical protein RHO25_000716 [Cercospora beticola]CAK1355604.1 unnamed protein product [Cercospora beticola]